MRDVRTHLKSPYILALYLIVAFKYEKYESHVTGHQLYDESSLITHNFSDMSSLDKNEVHYSLWHDISTGDYILYIFVAFTSNHYSSFDARLVSR